MSDVPIRVLVADDHGVVREGIRRVLEATADFQVVGEARDGPEVADLVRRHAPDVVVLDISMPGESGISVSARLRRDAPRTRILVLSMHDHPEYVLESIRAGAHGYLLKDTTPQELRDAVRRVHQGATYFSPAVAGRLSAAAAGELEREQRGVRLDTLTPREREVLAGIAAGRTNKEIGAELGISHRTVETHRESLMRKLDIRTVAGLTRLALEEGLITE